MKGVALGVVLAFPLVLGSSGLVGAQPKEPKPVAKAAAARDVPYRRIEDVDKISAWRGSKLIGSKVKDAAGKDIGKIEDLIFDRGGQVSYAVLSFGGLLGVGERLYAVPWSAMRLERDDHNNVTVMLDNVKKEALEAAPRYEERRVSEPRTVVRGARSDTMITAEVKSKLAREKLSTLTKIDVDTENGVVHLRGNVDTETLKQRATDLAREVKGVREVRNDLRVGG